MDIPSKSFLSIKASIGILFLIWIAIQFFIFTKWGVQTSVDSARYMAGANNLLSGGFIEKDNIWYAGYITFVALIFFLGGSLQQVVAMQILFSGIACLCLYFWVISFSNDRRAAFVSAMLYLCWFKIHQWNTFIYTESLYTSFTIITLACLAISRKPWHFMVVFGMVVFTFLIRPTGIAFLLSLVAYGVVQLNYQVYSRKATAVLGSIAMGLTLILVNSMLVDFAPSMIASYRSAEIIYPHISLGIKVPLTLTIPRDSHLPLIQIVEFIIYNPLYFLKISLLKLALFLGNVKPYFSVYHNIFIVLVLYPIYGLAIHGSTVTSYLKEKTFIISYVVLQAVIVSLTTENWDGRFLIPVLPFIFVLAALGISSIWPKFFSWFKLAAGVTVKVN